MHGVLWPELVLQWQLGPALANWMDQREGLRCNDCRSNLRSRHLAECLVSEFSRKFGKRFLNLAELREDDDFRSLRIAEINAAGDLHPYLKGLPHLQYSEFGSKSPEVPSENLLDLSYQDKAFDLVITSDVLEHVPDVNRALSEIHRILKPQGLHIFSVPAILSFPNTRRRAELKDGTITHILPQSHHGEVTGNKDDFLVFYEFGSDFIDTCKEAGFAVSIVKDQRNPTLFTLVATRV